MSCNKLVKSVSERIQFDLHKFKKNELEKIEVDSFNLNEFWTQFGAAVQGLSNEVTKIGIACGQQPYPVSGQLAAMLQDMMQSYMAMRDRYLMLPEAVGATVYQAVTSTLISIVTALLPIVCSLSNLSKRGAKERLMLTGTFWDECAAVDALPRNNLLATLRVIDGEISLAVDAKEELTMTIKEDCEALRELGDVYNSELWTNHERDFVSKAVGLVKTTHICLQKVRKAVCDYGSCSISQHCQELDATAAEIRTISPALDNFVSELYHPLDVPTALANASKLVAVLRSLLQNVMKSHYKQGIDVDVFNKLMFYISHNYGKLDPSVMPNLSTLEITPQCS